MRAAVRSTGVFDGPTEGAASLLFDPFTDQRRLVDAAGCRRIADCLMFVLGEWNAHHVQSTERGLRDLFEFAW
jgi:hypothetical protein